MKLYLVAMYSFSQNTWTRVALTAESTEQAKVKADSVYGGSYRAKSATYICDVDADRDVWVEDL